MAGTGLGAAPGPLLMLLSGWLRRWSVRGSRSLHAEAAERSVLRRDCRRVSSLGFLPKRADQLGQRAAREGPGRCPQPARALAAGGTRCLARVGGGSLTLPSVFTSFLSPIPALGLPHSTRGFWKGHTFSKDCTTLYPFLAHTSVCAWRFTRRFPKGSELLVGYETHTGGAALGVLAPPRGAAPGAVTEPTRRRTDCLPGRSLSGAALAAGGSALRAGRSFAFCR